LAKQRADSDSLETTLFRARELAEELRKPIVLYFIDMAILEAGGKNTSATINYTPLVRQESRALRKKAKPISHSASKAT
jgi:hypothetical protein